MGKSYVDFGTFEGCENLKSIHLPNNITSFDYDKTFSNCINLKYLLLPNKLNYVYPEQFSGSGIEELDMTENNTGTTYVFKGTWPSSLKRLAIASMQKQTDYSAMHRLNRLKVLPQANEFERTVEWSGYYFPIEADSLYLCDSSLPLNAHKSYSNKYYRHYGDYKYLYMGRNLTVDDESCTIEESIGSNLEALVIGPLVTEIKMEKAGNLKSIESKITVPLQVEPSFPKDVYINVPLIVPYGTKSQYEQAPGWKEFFEIQESGGNSSGITTKHSEDKVETTKFNVNGQRIIRSEAGISIIRFNDGSVEKIVVKH